mgnify:CR=1 FL=1
MGWSPDFIAGLGSGSIVPEYELRFIDVSGSVGRQVTIGSSGIHTPSPTSAIKIDAGSVQVQGTSVVPQRWAVSFGGWSVGLTGDIRKVAFSLRRGQFTELWCRLNGFSGFERVAMGSLDNISGSRGIWRLTFRDLISAFQNSLSSFMSGGYDKFQIFNRAGISTETDATWATSDSTMSVVNVNDWDLPTGAAALVQCFTSPTTYFFAQFTGKAAGELTGVSGVDYPIGNVAVGTLSSGSTVKYVPWIQGKPWIILGRLLTSTGTGSNGPFDKYPDHWALGGKIDEAVFDYYDARENNTLIKRGDGSNKYLWSHAVELPWANGFRDLVTLSSEAGQWPVQRQGYVSWRGCSDPTGLEMGYEPRVVAHLDTSTIHQIISHEFYNSAVSTNYAATAARVIPVTSGSSGRIVGSTNFSLNRVPSLPYRKEIERDLRFLYADDDGTGADERADMGQGDLNRMKGWDLYPSEKLVLRVSLKYAILCAGDVVEITSGFLSGLYMGSGKSFNAQRAMVLNCSYVIGSASCVLHLGILSGREKR